MAGADFSLVNLHHLGVSLAGLLVRVYRVPARERAALVSLVPFSCLPLFLTSCDLNLFQLRVTLDCLEFFLRSIPV
jgi:hypothetical protein